MQHNSWGIVQYANTCIHSTKSSFGVSCRYLISTRSLEFHSPRMAALSASNCSIHVICVLPTSKRLALHDVFRPDGATSLHFKNKEHLHVLLWYTCVLKETHTHVYGQPYMFLNKRMRFCKLHITCFTITRHVLELHIGCFKITHWVF